MIEWIQSNWMSIVGTVAVIGSLKEDSYTNGRKACLINEKQVRRHLVR